MHALNYIMFLYNLYMLYYIIIYYINVSQERGTAACWATPSSGSTGRSGRCSTRSYIVISYYIVLYYTIVYITSYALHYNIISPPPNNNPPTPLWFDFVGVSFYEGGNRRLGPPPPYPSLNKVTPPIIASKCPCPYANRISEAFRIDVVYKSMFCGQ